MATIKLQRTNQYFNRLRDYHIFIDGQKIGTIANGETKEFETTDGQHSLVAKIDYCSSPEITFNINQSETKNFKVGEFRNGYWIMLVLPFLVVLRFILSKEWTMYIVFSILAIFVYFITIGRKKYLTLTELN